MKDRREINEIAHGRYLAQNETECLSGGGVHLLVKLGCIRGM